MSNEIFFSVIILLNVLAWLVILCISTRPKERLKIGKAIQGSDLRKPSVKPAAQRPIKKEMGDEE